MFDRLRRVKNQYEELLRRMEEPETYSDPSLYARCDREARELRALADECEVITSSKYWPYPTYEDILW